MLAAAEEDPLARNLGPLDYVNKDHRGDLCEWCTNYPNIFDFEDEECESCIKWRKCKARGRAKVLAGTLASECIWPETRKVAARVASTSREAATGRCPSVLSWLESSCFSKAFLVFLKRTFSCQGPYRGCSSARVAQDSPQNDGRLDCLVVVIRCATFFCVFYNVWVHVGKGTGAVSSVSLVVL
jgi:hypothetical protein